ncbi:MAG: DUF3501 family protein [Rhodospirillaceae bacterium]|nr:DUF3501 family protein [Rhodospirillaceae bacterium]
MSQPRRALTRDDIMDMADYAKVRNERRAAITALKRSRRLAVGPFATFHFECFETMWMQVHEMLHIERGGEEQIAGELEAYNPLIPRGDALIATLMLEIDDPARRERELYRLAGIEDTIKLEVGGAVVAAQPIEDEVARTTEDGKTSSIHFLRFPFSPVEAAGFRAPGTRVLLGVEHPAYGHLAVMPEETRAAIAEDLDEGGA